MPATGPNNRSARDGDCSSSSASNGSAKAVDIAGARSQQRTSLRGQGTPEFSELVLACRHRLGWTLGLGSVVSLLAVVVGWLAVDATYRSESFVRVRQREDVVFAAQSSRSDDAVFVRAQSQLALSSQVLSAALADESLRQAIDVPRTTEGVEWLRGVVRAEAEIGAEVLSITANHKSADVSHATSQAVTRAYLNEVTSRLQFDQTRRRSELEQAAKTAADRLDELWAELNQTASELGTDNSQSITIRDQMQMQAYRDYSQQLRVARLRRNELQSMLTDEQLRVAAMPVVTEAAQPIPIAVKLVDPMSTAEIVRLRRHIEELDIKISQIRHIAARPDTPRIDSLVDQRKFYASQLTRLQRLASTPATPSATPSPLFAIEPAKPVNDLAKLQKQVELNEAECEFLQARLAEIDTTVTQSKGNNGVDLEMARHAVERQSRLADGLWQSLEELKIESQSQPRVKLMSMAEYPLHANHLKRVKAAGIGFMVGWIFTVLAIGFIEWRSCLVREGCDVIAIADHPVFGLDASESLSVNRRKGAASTGASETAARLMLQAAPRSRSDGSIQIPSVMLTGSIDGDLSHFVATDLAIAFASYQRRTLLIDCDTTQGRLSQQLGIASEPGLRQCSQGNRESLDVVIPTSHAFLDLLPVGNGAKVVASESDDWVDPLQLQSILTSLRPQYDAIVLHGPSLSGSADGLLLGAQVDQVLLAAVFGTSRWTQLKTCQDVAASSGIDVAGFMLHDGAAVDMPTPLVGTSIQRRSISTTQAVANESDDCRREDELRQHIAVMQEELRRVASDVERARTTTNNSDANA